MDNFKKKQYIEMYEFYDLVEFLDKINRKNVF